MEPYKNQINITKHFIWDTLDINWSSVMLQLGTVDITLPTFVTVPLMRKYRVRNNIDNNDLISYIMLLTGVTWQDPHKLNAIAMQDIYHFLQHCNFFEKGIFHWNHYCWCSDWLLIGRMSCTLPKNTLDIVVMTNCEWIQVQIFEDEVCRPNMIRP